MPIRHHLRTVLKIAALTALLVAPALQTGCASAHSPTATAIERTEGSTHTDNRMAPMAARRRGMLIAGDGFGRMAYSGPAATATASVDTE